MVEDIAATKGFLSNSIFFCASCRQFYHYGLKPEAVPGVQWDLCLSGAGGMQEGRTSWKRAAGMVGVGAWWDLLRMENCHRNSPTSHLPMENPIPAPLFSVLCVATVAPQEIILKGVALLQRGWSEKASEKGAARGGICPHQAGGRQGQTQKPSWAQRCPPTATIWFPYFISPPWEFNLCLQPSWWSLPCEHGTEQILQGGFFPWGIRWGSISRSWRVCWNQSS